MDRELPFNPDDLTDSDWEFLEYVSTKDPRNRYSDFIDLVLKIHELEEIDPTFKQSVLLEHFITTVGIEQVSRAEDAIIMGENICKELCRVK